MLLCCGSQTRDWIGESSHITFLSIIKIETRTAKLYRPVQKGTKFRRRLCIRLVWLGLQSCRQRQKLTSPYSTSSTNTIREKPDSTIAAICKMANIRIYGLKKE
jgi:hypothetical protein